MEQNSGNKLTMKYFNLWQLSKENPPVGNSASADIVPLLNLVTCNNYWCHLISYENLSLNREPVTLKGSNLTISSHRNDYSFGLHRHTEKKQHAGYIYWNTVKGRQTASNHRLKYQSYPTSNCSLIYGKLHPKFFYAVVYRIFKVRGLGINSFPVVDWFCLFI